MKNFMEKFYTPFAPLIFIAGALGMVSTFVYAAEVNNTLMAMLSIAPFVTVVAIGILFMLLTPLEMYIKYLTHGEVNIDLNGVVKLYGRDMFESWAAYMVLVYGIFGVVFILWLLPFSVVLVLGLLYALSKLTRFVFGVAVKLKGHVTDPDAHTRGR